MKIKAEFIGSSSLGYKTGKEYEIEVNDRKGMSVKRCDGDGLCYYESISSFLKNWTNIKHK